MIDALCRLSQVQLGYSRAKEGLAIEVDGRIRSGRVIEVLSRLVSERATPLYLRADNGPEFVSRALLECIVDQGVGSALIDSGKPWQYGKRFAAPGEHLLRRQPMSARNHRHRCSRLQRLLNDPRLVIHRPTTTSAGTGDHLDAPDRPFRLKRRFKFRHKPILILTPGSAPAHLSLTFKRRPQNIAYEHAIELGELHRHGGVRGFIRLTQELRAEA